MATETTFQGIPQLTEEQRREMGARLTQQLIDALRVTTLRLGVLLEHKKRRNPSFDQKAIDEASAHQNTLLKRLLEIRRAGATVDLSVLVRMAKHEKIHEFSSNLVAVTIDGNTPGKTPFSVTTRLSEIPVEGGSVNAYKLLTEGIEQVDDDATAESPTSYLWRTATSELVEIGVAKEQVRQSKGTESLRYRALRDLEFSILRDRFLIPGANHELPINATADYFVRSGTIRSDDPSTIIKIGVSMGTQLRTPEFKFPVSVITRNNGLTTLQQIDLNHGRKPQLETK